MIGRGLMVMGMGRWGRGRGAWGAQSVQVQHSLHPSLLDNPGGPAELWRL